MFIPEFVCGILATIGAEIMLLIGYAIFRLFIKKSLLVLIATFVNSHYTGYIILKAIPTTRKATANMIVHLFCFPSLVLRFTSGDIINSSSNVSGSSRILWNTCPNNKDGVGSGGFSL